MVKTAKWFLWEGLKSFKRSTSSNCKHLERH